MTARARHNGAWRRYSLDLVTARELLRDYARPCEGVPNAAFVFRDSRGRHRRLTASYSGGWSLQINFDLKGAVSSYTLSCAMKIGRKKGAA